jgi:hypothetical protein
MEDQNLSNNFTLYLLLLMSLLFVAVDFLELSRVTKNWELKTSMDNQVFEQCIKHPLLAKMAFSIFSLLSAISATVLTLCLAISVDFFTEKGIKSYIHMNYVLFGPYMLGFCILGLINWDNIMYLCDRHDFNIKVFSVSTLFNLAGCLILSFLITGGSAIHNCVMNYTDAILRREGGPTLLRSIFWWAVLKNRSNEMVNRLNGRHNEERNRNNSRMDEENHVIEIER